MCRGVETMRRAFAALDDAVRGINVTNRRVIFTKGPNGFDLVGFFVAYNDCEANYFKVDAFGHVSPHGLIDRYDPQTMTNGRVARGFNAPCAVVRNF